MQKTVIWTVIFCLALTACQSRIFPAPELEPVASPTDPEPILTEQAVLEPEISSAFANDLIPAQQHWIADLEKASHYNIQFVVEDSLNVVTGTEEVRYTNREDLTLEEIWFRLLPNVLGGEMTVSSVFVNGGAVTPAYEMKNSLMRVPLEKELRVGESTTFTIEFTLHVPTQIETNYGILAYYDGVLALAHAYPMVAVYDDEGWNAEITPDQGDPTYNDASFYIVSVDAPDELVLVASGVEVKHEDNGSRQTVTYEAGPARDFYVAASADYEVVTKTAEGMTVHSYYRDDGKAGAQAAMDFIFDTFLVLGKRYTPYPYTEFDIVPTPTYALGIEYPGVIAITDRLYDLQDEPFGLPNRVMMESVIAHEGAHQWFYNMIGNDQLDEPWLDESLSQFVTWQYHEDTHGPRGASGFEGSLRSRWEHVEFAEIPIGHPVASYDGVEYGAIIYGRGAFFFETLREQMGQDVFDAFMLDYAKTYTWGISNGESLKALAEEHCGCDLTSLYEAWLY